MKRNSRVLLLASLCLLSACASSTSPRPAQPAAPAAEVVKQPPASTDEKAYWRERRDLIQLPRVARPEALRPAGLQRARLAGGTTVQVLPDKGLPLVEVSVLFRVGSIDDPPDRVGLAEFTSEMLRQGTRRLSADAISEMVDAAGISLSTSSGYELSQVSCSGRRQSLDLCLQVLAEVIIRPTFPAKEMDEIRDRLLSAVNETRDDPAELATQHFNNLLYGDDHPAGRPMTAQSVQRITREDLVEFHRRYFSAANAIIGVSGDVDPKTITEKLEHALAGWPRKSAPERSVQPVKSPAPGLRVILVDKPDLTQSFFSLGHGGIRRTDPEREAVMVMNYVLGGGGFSSRLMRLVRSEGGKTYGIRSQFDDGTVDGSFVVQSFTRNDQLVAMLQQVRAELGRISAQPPTNGEVEEAKGDLAGGYAIRFQTPARLLSQLMRAQIWGLPDSFVTEFALRVGKLSPDEVAIAARAHVNPGSLVAAVVGRASVVAPLLRQAQVPFEQVSYLDPISAAERRSPRVGPPVAIGPAEMTTARLLLEKALAAAGGRARLAGIRSLRLLGRGQVEEVEGEFRVLLLLPDHARLSFDFKKAEMVQMLAGDQAFIEVGGQRKPVPPEVQQRMQGLIWRDPVLLPLHALGPEVRYRLSRDGSPSKEPGRTAIDLYPPGLPMTTVVLDRKGQLTEIRYRTRSGQLRVTELRAHRRVPGGVLVPHQVTEVTGKRRQTVSYYAVEINPAISKKDILAPSAVAESR